MWGFDYPRVLTLECLYQSRIYPAPGVTLGGDQLASLLTKFLTRNFPYNLKLHSILSDLTLCIGLRSSNYALHP